MRKITCDRCGADLKPAESDNTGYIKMAWRTLYTYEVTGQNPFEYYDFCEDCMKDIADYVTTNPKALPDDRIVDIKPDPEPEEPKGKIYTGKIKALYRAGWTITEIQGEMGISAPTIRKYLKEAGLK